MNNLVRLPDGKIINMDNVYRLWVHINNGERWLRFLQEPSRTPDSYSFQVRDLDGKIYEYFCNRAEEIE